MYPNRVRSISPKKIASVMYPRISKGFLPFGSRSFHKWIRHAGFSLAGRLRHFPRRNHGRSTTYPSREEHTRTSSPILNLPRHAVQQLRLASIVSPRSRRIFTDRTGSSSPKPESFSATMAPRVPRLARYISAATNIPMRKTMVRCSIFMGAEWANPCPF